MSLNVREESNLKGAFVVERISKEVFRRYSTWDSNSVLFYVSMGGKVFVAYEGEEAVGVAFLRKMEEDLWELTLIAVLQNHRRKGVGRELMREMLKEVSGSVYLHVSVENGPAIRLYESLGFKKVRLVRNFYSTGEDAYLMVLNRNPRCPEKRSDLAG